MKRKISWRGIILGILGAALLGGLVYLIISLASTDWRTYDVDEVKTLFSSYYGEEGFAEVDNSFDALSDVGIMLADKENAKRQVLVMKNFDLNSPTISEDDIAAGYRYRYMLLETGLTSDEVTADYESALLNIENTRDYYTENEGGNETSKVLYENAIVGYGHDYVYVFIGDEAELMKREMEMLLK